MADEEFQAPEWIRNEEELKPVSTRQKIYFLLVLIIVIPFCIWAGWYEWNRAQEGHWRAWVYTFEWPLFAGVAIYMYRKFLKGDIPKIPRPNFDKFNDND